MDRRYPKGLSCIEEEVRIPKDKKIPNVIYGFIYIYKTSHKTSFDRKLTKGLLFTEDLQKAFFIQKSSQDLLWIVTLLKVFHR